MVFNFKDEESEFMFTTKDKNDFIEHTDDKYLIEDNDETIEYRRNEITIQVSSNPTSLEYLEDINNKLAEKKKTQPLKSVNQPQKEKKNEFFDTSTLQRIEQKQNVIIEMLEQGTNTNLEKISFRGVDSSEIEQLKLNLELFSSRFVILDFKSDNNYIEDLLYSLKMVTENILSNSFHIFNRDKSPVKLALKQLENIGMGDYKINKLLTKTENLLLKIDKISNMNIFERNFNYSNILLDKSLLLNSITLLNESTSIYIIEAVKRFSPKIGEYTTLVGEAHIHKLYSNAKDFFIALFEGKKETVIPLFSHHKTVKSIDKEIAKKMLNIHKTWTNKGDAGLFKRYAYIMARIRYIRNSVAHGNMDTGFGKLHTELLSLNQDFHYLTIQKNILKK